MNRILVSLTLLISLFLSNCFFVIPQFPINEEIDFQKFTEITLIDESRIIIETNFFFKMDEESNRIPYFIGTDLFKTKDIKVNESYLNDIKLDNLGGLSNPDLSGFLLIYLPRILPNDIKTKKGMNHWKCVIEIETKNLDTAEIFKEHIGLMVLSTSPFVFEKPFKPYLIVNSKDDNWGNINPMDYESNIKKIENQDPIIFKNEFFIRKLGLIQFYKKFFKYTICDKYITIHKDNFVDFEYYVEGDLSLLKDDLAMTYELPIGYKNIEPSFEKIDFILKDGSKPHVYIKESFNELESDVLNSSTESYGYCFEIIKKSKYLVLGWTNPNIDKVHIELKTKKYQDINISNPDPFTILYDFSPLYDPECLGGDFKVHIYCPENMEFNKEKIIKIIDSDPKIDSEIGTNTIILKFKDSKEYRKISIEMAYPFKNSVIFLRAINIIFLIFSIILIGLFLKRKEVITNSWIIYLYRICFIIILPYTFYLFSSLQDYSKYVDINLYWYTLAYFYPILSLIFIGIEVLLDIRNLISLIILRFT